MQPEGMQAVSNSDTFGTTINTRHSDCLLNHVEVQQMICLVKQAEHCSGATAYLATGSKRD